MTPNTINTEQLFTALDDTWNELIIRVSDNSYAANEIPFDGSWTIAQLATHITKSNKAITQGMYMNGKPADRDPEAGVPDLKKMFLDFERKFPSPDFIVPEERDYIREDVISSLTNSINNLKDDRSNQNLFEVINMKIFGEVTKLELLHFVLYHTQRHVHQLKNIQKAFKNKS